MEATEQPTTKHILHEIFQELKDEDFETFKWFLQNPIGFEKIPTGKLQSRNRCETVDLMDQTYAGDCLKVTRTILTKIKRYDLLENLTDCVPQAAASGTLLASGTSHRAGAEKDPEPSVKDLLPKFTALSVNSRTDQSIKSRTDQSIKPTVDQSGEKKNVKRFDLQKYSCQLTFDTNTVDKWLKLSDNNKKATLVRDKVQPYPDHPDRFDWYQLLCREPLTDQHYWEVDWIGKVLIAVSYRGIRKKGDFKECVFGYNDQSWSLRCCDKGYYVRHKDKQTHIPSSSFSSSSSSISSSSLSVSGSASDRVAVYVDRPAGSLSFYKVCSDSLKHIYTFNVTFTEEPLYAGFRVWQYGGSVSLVSL